MASEIADRTFWPPIASIFDFTLHFEEYIFTIAPSAIAIALIACMLFYYMRKPTLVRNGALLWFKLVSRSLYSRSIMSSCHVLKLTCHSLPQLFSLLLKYQFWRFAAHDPNIVRPHLSQLHPSSLSHLLHSRCSYSSSTGERYANQHFSVSI